MPLSSLFSVRIRLETGAGAGAGEAFFEPGVVAVAGNRWGAIVFGGLAVVPGELAAGVLEAAEAELAAGVLEIGLAGASGAGSRSLSSEREARAGQTTRSKAIQRART